MYPYPHIEGTAARKEREIMGGPPPREPLARARYNEELRRLRQNQQQKGLHRGVKA